MPTTQATQTNTMTPEMQAARTAQLNALHPRMVTFLQTIYPGGHVVQDGNVVFGAMGRDFAVTRVVFPENVPPPVADVLRVVQSMEWLEAAWALTPSPAAAATLGARGQALTVVLAAYQTSPSAQTWRALIDAWEAVIQATFAALALPVSPRMNPYLIYGAIGVVLLAGGAWLVTRKG